MATPLLTLGGVTLRFKGLIALNDVSLEVEQGQIVGIIGPNGAGKSSLLNCVNGFYRPSDGSIQFADSDLTRMRPYRVARLGVARTFQGLEVVERATVLENVLLGRHIHSRAGVLACSVYLGRAWRDERRQRKSIQEALELCDLTAFVNVRVGELSYGQQKRVAIARALAMDPRLLLLDEPTAGLTLEDKRDIASLMLRLQAETSVTQVLIEHDVRLIGDLCDYAYVLDFGNLIAQGRPATVLNDDRVVEAYLGRTSSPSVEEREVMDDQNESSRRES